MRCAFLRYHVGWSQKEIARTLHLSAPTVSRCLKHAVERRLVEVRVPVPHEKHVEFELSAKLGIEVRVAARFGWRGDTIRKAVAAVAAEYFCERIVPSVSSVGIDGGKTLKEMVRRIPLTTGKVLKVYPLVARMPGQNVASSPVGLVAALCACFDHRDTFGFDLPVGYARDREERDRLVSTGEAKEIYEGACNVDVAITGIGSLERNSTLHHVLQLAGVDLDEIHKRGIVGSIGYSLLDRSGRTPDTALASRLIAVDALRLKELASTKRVVAVAGGKEKYEPLVAALRGRYLNILITDSSTARQLLREKV